MNRRIIFGILLVALNAAMWFVFVRQQSAAKAVPVSLIITNSVKHVKSGPPVVVVRTNAFNWEQLESEDYRTYIERLRSIGCPEQTIRDIVIADLEKLMAPRVQQINGAKEPPKYWKPDRKELVRTLET